jgi:hypothetical protein
MREKRSVKDCCDEDCGSLAAEPNAPPEDEQPALNKAKAHTPAAGMIQFE